MSAALRVWGLSGKSGSGKDYAAEHVFLPAGVFRFSLSWHFKIWAVAQGHATYEEVFHTKPAWVRDLLQSRGTQEGRKVFGQDIWVRTVEAWLRLLHEQWGHRDFVLADVRFLNEAAMVHRMGGHLVRMVAPARVAATSLTEEQRLHESETELDAFPDWDGYLLNDPGDPSLLLQMQEIARRVGQQDFAQVLEALTKAAA